MLFTAGGHPNNILMNSEGDLRRQNIPALEEGAFSASFDLPDPFHGFYGRLHKVTVIANGNISPFLEVNC